MSTLLDPSRALDFTGRTAVVTGASGGIGGACARALAAAGARTYAVDLEGHPAPEGTTAVACDVARKDDVAALEARVRREAGRLDALIHAAGITRDGMLWNMEDDAWHQVIDVNLHSGFLLRAFAPLLKETGRGSVVLVTSINGERGKRGQANYAASKAGLAALGKTAAIEMGRHGTRVNSVAPGWIETAMTAGVPEDYRRRAVEESALGRTGAPEDVAGAVLFLCSDLARHVTGQVLRVDGGQLTA